MAHGTAGSPPPGFVFLFSWLSSSIAKFQLERDTEPVIFSRLMCKTNGGSAFRVLGSWMLPHHIFHGVQRQPSPALCGDEDKWVAL